jgi:hypothetical protein
MEQKQRFRRRPSGRKENIPPFADTFSFHPE